MHLVDKSLTMAATTTTKIIEITTAVATPITAETTISTAAASPFKKLLQKFNISSPDKRKLAMEFVSEMDTPQKVSGMRALVKGSRISIECHNNQSKKIVRIPQCLSEASVMSQAAAQV
jgi:hypothetical protein